MISLNEFLMNKNSKNVGLTSLDHIMTKYEFKITTKELSSKIADYMYNISGWEFDITSNEINKINKAIDKIPSFITFTNYISSDNDDVAWDLNDEIQHADKCKSLGHVKVDGYISIDFYKLDNADNEVYIVELNDDESTITCFVGKNN